MTATQPPSTRKQVRRVLLITLVLNLLVAAGKIAIGFITGALAITADGFHSLTDSAGNIAGLVANALAQKPPDADHPYGHRRFETLAALLIGALLLLTAWEMIQGVIDRLQTTHQPQITLTAFGVLGITLLINIAVSTYQMREGQRLTSEILLADAKNTRADVFVTLSVIISSVLVTLTGWVWVDVVAALVVVLLIGKAAWDIVQQTGRVLVDTAPYSPDELRAVLDVMPQVPPVERARSRGPVDAAHIDIDVRVPPEMTADQTNSLAHVIRQRLKEALHGVSEIEVHFLAHHPAGRDAVLTARAFADARGLSTHEVQVSRDERGVVLEMHVEVEANQTLADAHAQVSQLEADVAQALPHLDRVVTHIEPAPHTQPKSDRATADMLSALHDRVTHLLHTQFPDVRWHDITARRIHRGYALNLHAALPPEMHIETAHGIAESAEILLRGDIDDLSRVTIHTEPYDAAED
jgi:cation diffusion facilitator family transporter